MTSNEAQHAPPERPSARRPCPRCGSAVVRVHRNPIDRLVCRLTATHYFRFRCTNPHCAWTGLRQPSHLARPAGR